MPIKNPLILRSDSSLWKEQIQTLVKLRDVNFRHWSENNLFSLVWWLMLILLISLWFIWWKRVDKTRLHEIVTYGLMVSLIAIIIDVIGTHFVLWGYPNMLEPLVSALTVSNFALLPVTYMLIYQYFSDWKSFTIASVILSFLLAFVAEPIAILLDIYQMNNWKHSYDFPLYILLAVLLKWTMNKIMIIQKNS